MKVTKILTLLITFSLCFITGCSGNLDQRVDLDRVLVIMSTTISNFEKQTANQSNDPQVMDTFAQEFQSALNAANPELHPDTIGIIANNDGSFTGYNDKNGNLKKDGSERDLFKVEIDANNQRLLASEGQQVREQRFAGSGFFTGMLIGSMLSRQRTAGVNQNSLSNKKVTPRTSSNTQNRTNSARSRSRSGSYSRGK